MEKIQKGSRYDIRVCMHKSRENWTGLKVSFCLFSFRLIFSERERILSHGPSSRLSWWIFMYNVSWETKKQKKKKEKEERRKSERKEEPGAIQHDWRPIQMRLLLFPIFLSLRPAGGWRSRTHQTTSGSSRRMGWRTKKKEEEEAPRAPADTKSAKLMTANKRPSADQVKREKGAKSCGEKRKR